MANLNMVILIGRLGKDPELRHTPQGTAVCTLNLATNERWKDANGQKQESTQWHRVVVWGGSAENCGMYLKKGSAVHVVGKITSRSYEDKQGQKRFITEIKATDVGFLTPSKEDDEVASFCEEEPSFLG